METLRKTIVHLIVAVTVAMFSVSFGYAELPLQSTYTGIPPSIDGDYYSTPDEWPSNTSEAALEIASPIHTLVFIKNDSDSLFMMVNAASVSGDYAEEDDDHCSVYVFKSGKGLRVTVRGNGVMYCQATNDGSSPLSWVSITCPTGVVAADGFGPSPEKPTDHRMYEFGVPLNTIGAHPGDTIYFASPFDETNSLPYDSNAGSERYNLWPPDSSTSDLTTWGQIQLASNPAGIPTMSGWGIVTFTVLAGLGSVYLLRRQNRFRHG